MPHHTTLWGTLFGSRTRVALVAAVVALAALLAATTLGGGAASAEWGDEGDALRVPYYETVNTCSDSIGWGGITIEACSGGGGCTWVVQSYPSICFGFGSCYSDTAENDAWCGAMNKLFPEQCPPPTGDPEPQPSGGDQPGGDGEDEGNPPCPPGGCTGG